MKRILIPIPAYGFDPTEVAIPWKLMSEHKMEVVFATPEGKKASADVRMLSGGKLGIWKSVLKARQDAVDAYSDMERTRSFCNPLKYNDVKEKDVDAVLLPGGHDKGVKEFLESKALQHLVADFFAAGKPAGAICHGVVLAARSINPDTGQSVIHDRKTTSLLKSQELLAYNLTRLWLKDYYLTYPGMPVEEEVRSVLADGSNFLKGPAPLLRDSHTHPERGSFVRDGNYLSARWPGDAYGFSLEFIRMVQG